MKKFYYTILTIIGSISGGVASATAIIYKIVQNKFNYIHKSGHGLDEVISYMQCRAKYELLDEIMDDCMIILNIAGLILVVTIVVTLIIRTYELINELKNK